jgi:hypothetical protein
MRWDEEAERWRDATWALDLDEGGLSPLSWSLTAYDPPGSGPGGGQGSGGIAAGYVSPKGLVPPWAVELFGTELRTKASSDASPVPVATPPEARFAVDLAVRKGRLVMATLGQGVWELDPDSRALAPLGPDPAPPDLWALDVSPKGTLAALGRAGDAWVQGKTGWRQVRCGGASGGHGGDPWPGADLRWAGDRLRVAAGSTIEDFYPKAVACPPRGGARVLLAFSQHVNLYHSYRGDTNTDDGFGKDIRVIRSTLDIFDQHPGFHNDWDIENLFSLDDWLPAYAPDILEDISRRLLSGQDGMRLMSWNNGHVALETAEELGQSVLRGLASLEAFAPGLWTPGVQPQENSYTPAHPALYRSHGVEWITLFYSATSFTAFRQEVPLTLGEAHGVLTLASDLGPETMTLVPVYHHGDVMDHGGLATWLRQLHANLTGTAVLVIHFDADSETWEGFESELADVEAMDAPWVVPARLQDIVAEVAPSSTVTVRRDLADGAFDGFSSWTEKPVNHRFYTRVARSRLASRRAELLSGYAPSGQVQASLDAALDARLRTLSTTHFGLANPSLHIEREMAGEAVSNAAETQAASALAAVIRQRQDIVGPLALNTEAAPVTVLMPVAITVEGGGAGPEPALRTLESADGRRQWLAGALDADATAVLTPSSPVMIDAEAPDAGWAPHPTDLLPLEIAGPRLRVGGEDRRPEITHVARVIGEGGEVVTIEGRWSPTSSGLLRLDWIRLDADPGAWWVEATVNLPTLLGEELRWWEEMSPLELLAPEAAAWEVERPLVTGEVARYDVTGPFDALNSHAADGWLRLLGDGAASGPSIATHAPMRSAPAFAPIRFELTDSGNLAARLAPFGALWGELLDHDAASGLGAGVAEMATRLVAPQLQPTAPAWNGRTVCFLLRIQPHTADGDLPRLAAARDGLLLVDGVGRTLFREGCL